MNFEPIWGGIIAWYLFLAGLGGGAFIGGAFLSWKHPEATTIRRVARIIAPAVVIIGLLLLMMDAEAGLHNPLRFALLLSNFGSVMTWGVVFLAAFVVIALLVLLLDFLKKEVPWWLEVAGVVFALCVAAYTGALLGVAKTFPLWNNALLPILFSVSALSAGASAVLLGGAIFNVNEFHGIMKFKKAHYVLPLIEIILLASLLFITSSNSSAGFASVESLLIGKHAIAFWFGLVGVGLLLPVLIETMLLFVVGREQEESSTGRLASIAGSVGVLVGGFLLRYLVVVAALPLVIVS